MSDWPGQRVANEIVRKILSTDNRNSGFRGCIDCDIGGTLVDATGKYSRHSPEETTAQRQNHGKLLSDAVNVSHISQAVFERERLEKDGIAWKKQLRNVVSTLV